MASPEPNLTNKPSLQRINTLSDRLNQSKIPISFGIHDGYQSCFKLEKTILLKAQTVRLTGGASALGQKKDISTYGKLEYDGPEKISILDFKGDVKTFQPTIVLDTAQVELKKKFKKK